MQPAGGDESRDLVCSGLEYDVGDKKISPAVYEECPKLVVQIPIFLLI